MKKYKLKEDFAGKKAGEIFYPSTLYPETTWSYRGCKIKLDTDSELLEEVKDEPLFYTNEDEVYLDGKKLGIFKDIIYYLATNSSEIISTSAQSDNSKHYPSNKRFATEKAAEDYIKLQQAIKDSGLKIGDNILTHNREYTFPKWSSIRWNKYNSYVKDEQVVYKFIIYDSIPCLMTSSDFIFTLNQFAKPKLLFGDKEVSLVINKAITYSANCNHGFRYDVTITCNGENSLYSKCKDFRNALTTIQHFKFGAHNISAIRGIDRIITSQHLDRFTIGCTTGTIEQIDTILEACEKLLKS